MANNVKIICNVVEGAVPVQTRRHLQQQLQNAYTTMVPGTDRVTVIWMHIPEGQAYQARRPSVTSTLLIPVPNGFEQANRGQVMEAARDLWIAATRCAASQVVISVADQSWVEAYIALNRNRIMPARRPWIAVKMLMRLLMGRLRTGMLAMTTNLDGR